MANYTAAAIMLAISIAFVAIPLSAPRPHHRPAPIEVYGDVPTGGALVLGSCPTGSCDIRSAS